MTHAVREIRGLGGGREEVSLDGLHVFSLAIHFELSGHLCAGDVTGYDLGQGPWRWRACCQLYTPRRITASPFQHYHNGHVSLRTRSPNPQYEYD